MKLHELFPEISLNPSSAKDIKQWILQLAVEGKLTNKWRKENGSINYQNVLINESEFKIPDNWKIKKIKEIGKTQTGGTPSKSIPEFFGNYIPFIKPGDINNWSVNYTNEGLSENGKLKLGRYAPKNSILMVCLGTIGKCALIEKDCCFNQQINSLTALDQNAQYLLIAMSSNYFQQYAWSKSTSTTIALLNKSNWENIFLPLPPLEEQQAIVTIVENLFKEVDELAKQATQRIELKRSYAQAALKRLCEADTKAEWQQLVSVFPEIFNDKQTIKTLRETILQLAVQGKLTAKWRSSRASLPHAQELLDQIKAEKDQLVKEKKIKAEKPLPPIEADKVPFELPEGWVWTYLGESMLKITDGTHHSPINEPNGKFKYVTAKNIKDNGIKLSGITYVTDEVHKEIFSRCNPEFGDLLYIKDGATTGICCINNLTEEFSMLSSVALIKQPKVIKGDYLLTVFRSSFFYDLMRSGMTGVAITRVTLSKLKESMIPLPPLEEQIIIVEKVNALMRLCDELEREVDKKILLIKEI